MATRNADARWEGSLKEGSGTMRLPNGQYDGPFTFKSRFEEGEGTNPEELIAAAHAGCFSMALSGELGKAGHDPESVETEAAVSMRMGDGGPRIAKIVLTTRVRAPGLEDAEFQELAQGAKENCPVSKALAAVDEIELEATLES